jgi:integrase
VTGPKNHHRRTIPINPRLHDLLATSPAPAIGMGDFLFAGVTEQQARKAVRDACSATGLPDFTFHAFRRYFGTLCIRSGVDIPTVARWMGHKDGGRLLLKTYSAAQEDHQREQAKKVLVAA